MIIYSYDLVAKPDAVDDLRRSLADIAEALHGAAGYQGSEVLRLLDDGQHINFRERWESVDAHDAAGHLLPGAVMTAMMAALSEKPKRQIYEAL